MLNVAFDIHMSMSEYFAAYNIDFLLFSHFSKFWHLSVAEFSAAVDLSFLKIRPGWFA